MSTLGLYLTSVLIWGSTWLAITFQFGTVPPVVSVAYRFALAGLILLAWARIKGLRLRFSAGEHLWMALQGLLLFGINYMCVYLAEAEVTSGLVAVVFSLLVVLNIVGTRIVFGTPLKRPTMLGAVLGIGGIVLVFLPEIGRGTGKGDPTLGVLFALGGAVTASLGNIVASRNHGRGLPVVQMNTFGMLYGALFVAAFALVTRQPFLFDWSPRYLLSLAYLAVFGSILAFGAFLVLLGRIGADRAGYITVAIPIVALLLSAFFEGLRWHMSLALGILLCVAGNVAVLWGRGTSRRDSSA
ncbi:MAG TPA: EamA family transporter [Candidatus Polarisedimenticolia bacterium]|nr:EamA family transporter [Candidatus Polarisedimenticolia bacterium]